MEGVKDKAKSVVQPVTNVMVKKIEDGKEVWRGVGDGDSKIQPMIKPIQDAVNGKVKEGKKAAHDVAEKENQEI
jgi:hypothetical protein